MPITGFRLDAPASHGIPPAALDPSQLAVVHLEDAASAAVIGAAGTGKTTTLIEVVADRILQRGWAPESVLALTTSRVTASRLRDRLALRVERPTPGPLARTVASLAFEVVGAVARAEGRDVAPRMISGDEQDRLIRDLLAGHLEDGTGPQWPDTLPPEVRELRRFRTEVRELMMRATEYGVTPDRLRQLGADLGHPEWIAVADLVDELAQVSALGHDDRFDHAELLAIATAAIERGEGGPRIEALRLVLVDDLQEATESTLALLRALSARGVGVIAFGDPDVAANAFRGGEPDALGRLAAVLGKPVDQLILSTAHRQGPALRAFTAAVTERIGTAAAGRQRAAVAGHEDDALPLARIEAPSQARSLAAVARVLRARHLEHDVPWNQLAVVVRSGAQIPAVTRSLAMAEVPTRVHAAASAIRDDAAARALLTLVDVGIGRTELTPALATELLLGPFGGLDRLGLRRLRLALRAEEVAGGGNRPADELLVEALSAPGRLATIDHRVARAADRLATTLAKLRENDGSIEELLWLAWERSGLARTWYEQAIGDGLAAADANRNLDGILAVFTAAKRFVERRPADDPRTFLTGILDAEVPEDTLTPQPADDAVLVTTPAGAVGIEVDTVVVTGLQDGAWPNVRLRGSLLHPQELVRAITGVESSVVDERKQVLGDELRMLALAVSRARNRVVLAAVANDDEPASPFLSLLPPSTPVIDSKTVTPLSLRGLTGELRRRAVVGPDRAAAVSALAALAAEGLPGADPSDWHGLQPITTTGPLYDGQQIPVSPSSIEKLIESPLDWFLERMAGSESGVIANVGTIVHWAMETAEDQSAEGLWAAVESRWNELLFDAPWLAERQRRIARTFTDALADYLADFAGEGKQLVGAESRFQLEIERAVLSGSIDRVERDRDGKVVIVDLKTGSPITKQQALDEHPQLSAYQLAYAEGILDDALAPHGAHEPGGAKLLFVKEGVNGKRYREGRQEALGAEQLAEFRQRVIEASMLIAAATFEGVNELPMFGRGDPSRLRLHRVRAVSSD